MFQFIPEGINGFSAYAFGLILFDTLWIMNSIFISSLILSNWKSITNTSNKNFQWNLIKETY